MSGGFGTQPGELEAVAQRFDECSTIISDALGTLRSTLGGLGDYVGSDEQGRQFGAGYHPKVTEGITAIGAEAAAVRSLGNALRASAREYGSSDRGNAVPFRAPGS